MKVYKSYFIILLTFIFFYSCSKFKYIDYFNNHSDSLNECTQKINNPNNFYNYQQRINILQKKDRVELFTKLYKPNQLLIETINVNVVIKRDNREIELINNKITVQKSNIKYYSNKEKILIYPMKFRFNLNNSLINYDTILVKIKYEYLKNNFKNDTVRYIFVEK